MLKPEEYFTQIQNTAQKKYEALRDYYVNKNTASQTAEKHGYTLSSFYSLIREFTKFLHDNPGDDYFFKRKAPGKKGGTISETAKKEVISLRLKGFSMQAIKSVLDSRGIMISESSCYRILKKEGFSRLKKSSGNQRPSIKQKPLTAMDFRQESFNSSNIGILLLIPYLKKYQIDGVIRKSLFPDSGGIPKVSCVLSFLALKLSELNRLSGEELYSMDRGLGLFAGLPVLPEAGWFTSYGERVLEESSHDFMLRMHREYQEKGLLGNHSVIELMDVPCWKITADRAPKRMFHETAGFSWDINTGIIDFIRPGPLPEHRSDESAVFTGFYKNAGTGIKYLSFSHILADTEILGDLHRQGLRFYSINPLSDRSHHLRKISPGLMKTVHLSKIGPKPVSVRVYEENLLLIGYNPKESIIENRVRRLQLVYPGKLIPVSIITNDFFTSQERIAEMYYNKFILRKPLSEQLAFFNSNRKGLSLDISPGFDFLITALSHNLYRMFVMDIGKDMPDRDIFYRCLNNSGRIEIKEHSIKIILKKRKNIDIIIRKLSEYRGYKYDFLGGKSLEYASYSSS